MKTEIVGVRVDGDTKERFEEMCVRKGETASDVVRRLIQLYLKSGGKL